VSISFGLATRLQLAAEQKKVSAVFGFAHRVLIASARRQGGRQAPGAGNGFDASREAGAGRSQAGSGGCDTDRRVVADHRHS
jgi:hypothetical protein